MGEECWAEGLREGDVGSPEWRGIPEMPEPDDRVCPARGHRVTASGRYDDGRQACEAHEVIV
jgi:hypothetical protein